MRTLVTNVIDVLRCLKLITNYLFIFFHDTYNIVHVDDIIAEISRRRKYVCEEKK